VPGTGDGHNRDRHWDLRGISKVKDRYPKINQHKQHNNTMRAFAREFNISDNTKRKFLLLSNRAAIREVQVYSGEREN
jgi:hypothetical protein